MIFIYWSVWPDYHMTTLDASIRFRKDVSAADVGALTSITVAVA